MYCSSVIQKKPTQTAALTIRAVLPQIFREAKKSRRESCRIPEDFPAALRKRYKQDSCWKQKMVPKIKNETGDDKCRKSSFACRIFP